MKFVLSNFLSNEDLSISYESWDVQLTFDTLINAFRFKAKPLGGAKVKNACEAKLAEFRKTSAISSIFIKTSQFFWWKLFDVSFHQRFKALIKVSKVSWRSQLSYEIIRSSFERKFEKTNFISPKKLHPGHSGLRGLRNHFLWPICHLLYKDKELLVLRNNFRATKKFLIAKFDCITYPE